MYLAFLVEEQSMAEALRNLIPKILPDCLQYDIYSHNGKPDLLRKLPQRLRAFHSFLPADAAIIIIVDKDNDDCKALKIKLEQIAEQAGFVTKTKAPDGNFQVLTRLAITELEAWFLGDMAAINAVYPKVNPDLNLKAKYRNPDEIPHAWEELERILQKAGYHKGGLPKVKVAGEISAHMVPERNNSYSFKIFCQGLLAIIKRPQLEGE